VSLLVFDDQNLRQAEKRRDSMSQGRFDAAARQTPIMVNAAVPERRKADAQIPRRWTAFSVFPAQLCGYPAKRSICSLQEGAAA